MCNVVSEIKPFTMNNIYWMQMKNNFMSIASIFATVMLSPIILITLLFRLTKIKN